MESFKLTYNGRNGYALFFDGKDITQLREHVHSAACPEGNLCPLVSMFTVPLQGTAGQVDLVTHVVATVEEIKKYLGMVK